MINAAIREGLVACIATGNDDSTSYISSPAAADSCISVGATEHLVSLQHSDDLVSSFSNEGPRNEDLDLDHMDEMKPSVVAPGVNILSANGDPVTTTGQSYVTKSGTSMSTPHVSGVVALLLQANPNLTPMQVRDILQNTATHNILSSKGDRPNDPYGLDPNYDPGCGWGEVDAYAAALEAMNSTSGVQVVQIGATARPLDGAIDFVWQTQREFAFSGFNVYRAEDVAGAPGAFVQQNGSLIAGVGSSVIEGVPNRTVYTYEDTDAALQLGTRYWYQVEWVDNGSTAHPEPPVPVTYGELPAVAVVNFSYYHNTPDNDLVTALGVSFGHDESNPEFQTIGFSEATADSSVVVEPANAATAINGYIEWFHSYTLTAADGVGGNLPPSHTWPWFLKLDEGGFVNRQGRVTSFEMFVPDVPGGTTGTTYVTDSVLPEVTVETQTSVVWIPEIAVSSPEVGVSRSASTLQLTGANPFSNHLGIRFSLAADEAADGGELAVYDLNGRLVRRIWEGRGRSGDFVASWNGRDTQGSVAAPGVYFVRLRAGSFTSTAKATLIR
ncbi:MAG: hypothetical protein DHS20C21_18280 [Gemmatimonadota bacterium]|nr:MAG: hypothetical protein DHS20C21_18280 [Gemmatimonadota bacterium]